MLELCFAAMVCYCVMCLIMMLFALFFEEEKMLVAFFWLLKISVVVSAILGMFVFGLPAVIVNLVIVAIVVSHFVVKAKGA